MIASLPVEMLHDLFEGRVKRITFGTGKHATHEILFDARLVRTPGGIQVGVALTTVSGLRGSGTYFPLDEQGQADLLIYLGWLQNYVERPQPALQQFRDYLTKSQEPIRGSYQAHME
jgi:hypothetical protein